MVCTDVRATIAVAVGCIVTLFGELWFSWSYVCAGFLLTVAAVWLAADPRVQLSRDEKAGLVFIAWGVVTAFLVSQAYLDSKTTLASWTGAWLVWVAVSRSTRAGRRLVASILVAVAALSAGAVLAEFIGLARPRAGGLISNPNLTVAVIAPVLVLFSTVFRRRWLAWALAIMVAGPILLTGSRAGFLAVGAVALVVLPAGRMRRSALILGGFGLTVLMLWRTLANPESLAWHRWRIWRAVIEMAVDHPLFGIGAGSLGEAMGPYRLCHPQELGQWGHVIGDAESTPLGILARVGLPGAFLALLVVLLWLGRCRTLRNRRAGVCGGYCGHRGLPRCARGAGGPLVVGGGPCPGDAARAAARRRNDPKEQAGGSYPPSRWVGSRRGLWCNPPGRTSCGGPARRPRRLLSASFALNPGTPVR